MKRKWIIGIALCVMMIGAAVGAVQHALPTGETPAAKLQQTFLEASQAYDGNRPADAAALYTQLIDQGYTSKELYFNLGNSYFKMGKIGLAVLNYRRAWQMAPRDPDIQANLRFALQSTSASTPSYKAATRFLFKCSLSEWIILAVSAYWTAAIVLGVLLIWRQHRVVLGRALAALLLLLALGLAGILNVWIVRQAPEMVIVEPRQQALYAPMEGSKAHVALPEGSIVRREEDAGAWLKVAMGSQSGYVPSKACVPVDIR